jgi:hypothetical protein
VTDNFNVSLEFTLSGTIASGLVGFGLAYYVQYAFSGLGGAPDTVLNVPNATVPNQLVYGDPGTTATVSAGTLPVGTYELVATVTIPIIQAAAFVELPVVEIFQP